MSRTAHCLAALAASVIAGTAGSANLPTAADAPPSMTVRYADLDLHTAQGVATLYHRLTLAARAVCPEPDAHHLENLGVTRKCRQAAVARAVDTIGNPMLARIAVDHGVSND